LNHRYLWLEHPRIYSLAPGSKDFSLRLDFKLKCYSSLKSCQNLLKDLQRLKLKSFLLGTRLMF
jgi:hypothetical protein